MLALARSLQGRGSLVASELQSLVRAVATAATSAPAAAKPVVEKEFLVYRWDPDSGEAPRYDTYKVDINA